jgi:octanoyl-[GcvH]:protein N-octanoyltransferase
MCAHGHTRNNSFTLATDRTSSTQGHDSKPDLDLIDASFTDRAALGTGVSAAIVRRVARGDLPSTMRTHRTGRILAFGRIDRLSPGYPEALLIAREHGYEPIERMAGGRAAVFHEGTLAFSRATREANLRAGTTARFETTAELIAAALRRLGVDARIGEVEGEYCPGAWSVNAGGRLKLAGIGQRVVAGGAHVGGVLVFRGGDRIRDVLVPVYEELGLEWDPETAGSVAEAIGAPDPPADGPDPLLAELRDALRAELELRYRVREAELDEETMRLAEELRGFHAPKPREG